MSSLTPQAQTTIKPRASWEKNLDFGFVWLTRLLAMAIAAVLLWIALEVAIEAMPAIQRYGLGFFDLYSLESCKRGVRCITPNLRNYSYGIYCFTTSCPYWCRNSFSS